jgi:CRISPR type III-A-associated RAMP protein Csm4
LEDIVLSEANLTLDQGFVCEREETCVKMEDGIPQRISFYKTEVQQRVAVPSIDSDNESRPFYIDRIYFEKGCGFYFLVGFANNKIRKQVFAALKVLGENGIGTDRTVGNGLFSFNKDEDVSDFNLNITSQSGFYMPLGLYLPTQVEMDSMNLRKSSWNLLKRGGYMGGSSEDDFKHLLKKSIYMFGEGSVFSTLINLKGKYEDLKPDWNLPMHPVWRCGMPIFLKI